MTAPLSHGIVPALQEVERVSLAQLEAARSGRFAELRQLLATRQTLLEGLCGRVALREDRVRIAAADAETRAILQGEIRRVGEDLIRLEAGSRALAGYATMTEAPPAYLDQVR